MTDLNELLQKERFQRLVSEISKHDSWSHSLPGRCWNLMPDWLQWWCTQRQSNPITKILTHFAKSQNDVFFIQIGSCDGMTNDPIHRHIVKKGWRGIVVEPVPENFERLADTYKNNPSVIPVNTAISDVAENRPFFQLRSENVRLPKWVNQIGSFDRNHLLKHKVIIPNIEELIVETSVQCITLEQLIALYGVERIDLLHTDMEGFDWKVISQFDFANFQPAIILYEDLHLSAVNRKNCMEFLRDQGYQISHSQMDTIAYRSKSLEAPRFGIGNIEKSKYSKVFEVL